MFLVKDLEVLNLHPTLIEIIEDVEYVAGPGLYTSVYRPGDDGVHGTMPVRGIDRRCREAAMGNALKQHIDRNWRYDPDRPDMSCAKFHRCTEWGWHLHLQCHPNTRRRRT